MEESKVTLVWDRLGSSFTAGDLDVTPVVSLEGLAELVRAQAEQFVKGPFEVRLRVSVTLDGGSNFMLPYGNGELV